MAGRCALPKKLCEAWNWVNEALCDGVCRSLMLELERAELIELLPVRCRPPNNVLKRRESGSVAVDATPLNELQPIAFRQVRSTEHEPLFDALPQAHHYLGYTRPVGEHLKYLVKEYSYNKNLKQP